MGLNNFGGGLLTGLFLGGLAGLMNAPHNGKKTRENLKFFIDSTTEDVNDVRYKVSNLSSAVQQLMDEGMYSLNTAKESIEVSVRHFNEENSPRIRRVEEKVETLTTDLETQMDLIAEEAPTSNDDNNKNDK